MSVLTKCCVLPCKVRPYDSFTSLCNAQLKVFPYSTSLYANFFLLSFTSHGRARRNPSDGKHARRTWWHIRQQSPRASIRISPPRRIITTIFGPCPDSRQPSRAGPYSLVPRAWECAVLAPDDHRTYPLDAPAETTPPYFASQRLPCGACASF